MSTGGESFSNTRSLLFDGTDDYVISSLDGTSGGGVLASADSDVVTTISLWFKIPSFPSSLKGIFQWANALNDTSPFLLVQLQASGRIRFYVDGGYKFAQSVSLNTWYNIIITRTASNNTWTLYLNGSSIGTPYDDSGSQTARSSASSIYLGNGYNGYFNGFIDEVAIWNSDQSANISTIYSDGTPSNIASLNPISWWRFEEGSGTTATDSGTGGNNGTINGATYSTDVPS
tara:strand:- start:39 stop:731 length:693 start_codon:yes stop_codon:yes gene_type:complete